jgi:hypothetical protein
MGILGTINKDRRDLALMYKSTEMSYGQSVSDAAAKVYTKLTLQQHSHI